VTTPVPTRRLLILLGALTAFAPLSMELYLPGLPSLADDLGASASAAQLTITACMLGLAAGQLVSGPVSDALGRRRPLLAGVAVYTLTSGLCALAPDVWTLVGVRFLQGVAGAAGIAIARAMVRDITAGGAATARIFALLVLVTGVAPLLGPIVGGLLLQVTDWRGTFVALTLIGAALLTAALIGAPETLPTERRHRGGWRTTRAAMVELLADRVFLGYALCLGLSFGALNAYLAGSSFLLEDVHGLSTAAFGVIFAVNAGGMIAIAQVSAHFVRRTGPAPLLLTGLATGGVAGAAFLVATVAGAGLVLLLPCLFVLIASRGMANPNAQALALSDHPRSAGTASGLLGVCQYGLGGLAAPLAGLGGAEATLPMAIVIAACALGSAAVLLMTIRVRGRR
jgi:DHA1 family bicyclomycin/chloramphenicol resistance-like MFS transporter